MKQHSKGVTTPGVNDEGGTVDEGEVNETLHRAIATRGNYSAQDLPDIQFAAKEVSRFMSKPEAGDFKMARRLGRYLKDNGSSDSCSLSEVWGEGSGAKGPQTL